MVYNASKVGKPTTPLGRESVSCYESQMLLLLLLLLVLLVLRQQNRMLLLLSAFNWQHRREAFLPYYVGP